MDLKELYESEEMELFVENNQELITETGEAVAEFNKQTSKKSDYYK